MLGSSVLNYFKTFLIQKKKSPAHCFKK